MHGRPLCHTPSLKWRVPQGWCSSETLNQGPTPKNNLYLIPLTTPPPQKSNKGFVLAFSWCTNKLKNPDFCYILTILELAKYKIWYVLTKYCEIAKLLLKLRKIIINFCKNIKLFQAAPICSCFTYIFWSFFFIHIEFFDSSLCTDDLSVKPHRYSKEFLKGDTVQRL